MPISEALQDSSVAARLRSFADRLRGRDGSRYVYAYPFKGAYRPLTEPAAALDSWRRASGALNVYVHIPYCEMKCSFCNLLTTIERREGAFDSYVETVRREAELLAAWKLFESYEVVSIYFGGGTPTALSDRLLERILSTLSNAFNVRPDAEIALEATPDTVTPARLRTLRALGFDRISLGIQTFDAHELLAMGRSYDCNLGAAMLEAALLAGFRNVNADLIYGLPGQSPDSWLRSLRAITRLGTPTITAYPLVFRSRTRVGRLQRKAPEIFGDGEARYAMYRMASDFLESQGYCQRTMVAFTTLKEACLHETSEFSGVPTVGLGAGALSYAPLAHYSSGRYFAMESYSNTISAYLASVERNQLPVRSGIVLSAEERQRRGIILGLMYSGVDPEAYRTHFGEPLGARFGEEIAVLAREGCLEERSERLTLSKRGRFFSGLVADLFASDAVSGLSAVYG